MFNNMIGKLRWWDMRLAATGYSSRSRILAADAVAYMSAAYAAWQEALREVCLYVCSRTVRSCPPPFM
jgi:hypothetical protein